MSLNMFFRILLSFAICLSLLDTAYGQNYSIQQIPFQPVSTVGAPLSMIDDAVYPQGALAPIGFDIGFDFCFYGNVYNKFWIGSNGWISFSPQQTSTWVIPAGVTIPSATATYPRNCIMGPFEDWLPASELGPVPANVFWETRGQAPCRQLVVTFLDVSFFQCNTVIGTFQIILYESLNIIDNILYSKPSCPTWQGGRAIHGLHNLQGTLAAVVQNRNAIPFTAFQEAWRFTPQNMCPSATDTVKVITSDTTVLDYSVVEAACYDTTIGLKLNTKVFCNTVDTLGSDFRLYDHEGRLIQIEKVEFPCLNNDTDTLTIHIIEPLIYEETYFLVQRIGNDGNTIANCIGQRKNFDTTLVVVKDCYKYFEPVNITNVSVVNNESIEVTWDYPDTLDVGFFQKYVVYVNDSLNGQNWFALAESFNISDTSAVILNYNPEIERRDWHVRLKLKYYPLSAPGDSGSNILLKNPDATLFNGMRGSSRLSWNPYTEWSNPVYKVFEAKAEDTIWTLVGSTADTSFVYEKQRSPISYLLKVEAENNTDERVSVSNYLRYTQEQRDVTIVNVVTPNGDGANDKLFIQGIDFYPNSVVKLFNRWGQKVYESADYKNDWSPTSLEGGTYFCTVDVLDKGRVEGAVQIIK